MGIFLRLPDRKTNKGFLVETVAWEKMNGPSCLVVLWLCDVTALQKFSRKEKEISNKFPAMDSSKYMLDRFHQLIQNLVQGTPEVCK